ncbi:MAG: hypothetical protein Q9174_002606 [Haloplaca sp. 1 TL-2023]
MACTPLLKAILPIVSDATSYASRDTLSRSSRESILEDMPVSSGEFGLAWVALCAFEIDSQAWRPSAAILLKTWKAIMSTCTIKGLSLDRNIEVESLSPALDEDGIPEQILYAVIQRIKLAGSLHGAKIDSQECVPWVGAVLLQVMSEAGPSVTVSQFIRDWMDQLPESWRKLATLHILEGKYIQPTTDTIRFDESGAPVDHGLAEGKATAVQSRKWHEKFKSARR